MTRQEQVQKSNKGILFVIFAVLLWSTLGIGFKLAVTSTNDFTVAIYVGIVATIGLFITIVTQGKISELYATFIEDKWFFIISGVIGLGIQQILYLKAYQLLPATQTVILFYLYPLFMIIFAALFYKEKTSIYEIIAIITGFFGVYLVLSKGSLLKIDLSTGIIIVILASISWALFSVMIKQKKHDATISMFLFNFFGLIFLLLLIPFFELQKPTLSIQIISGIIYLGLFPTALAFLLWNKALQTTKTNICSNIALLTPILSLVWITIFLKEQLILTQILGAGIIIGSIVFSIWKK